MTYLSKIAGALTDATILGNPDTDVIGVTHDSRQVKPGYMFAALKGENVDGTRFVDSAIENGAVCVLAEQKLDAPIPQLIVPTPRSILGTVASVCYGEPSGDLALVGITGTNGKTTITYLIETVFKNAGIDTGVMGTVEYRYKDKSWDASHTTPEATVVQSVMKEMKDAGASHLVMETSSHGLTLDRLNGCQFDVVAFTNLTQDHLDFHETMEAYAAAKMRLFTDAIADTPHTVAVVNMDDPFGHEIVKEITHPVITISCNPDSNADIRPVVNPTYGIAGVRADITTPNGDYTLASPLLGAHNLNNLLVALGICSALNVPLQTAVDGLAKFDAVPGRLERVPCNKGFAVLVDYAHTPDALKRVLLALRPLTTGRLICVFGCGGDRDPNKRPIMGCAVAEGADIAVVTSDNPRTEVPETIVDMIIPGVIQGNRQPIERLTLSTAQTGYVVEVDRANAIRLAILAAREGDTVLIAGKGHEDYQILGTTKIHFDDREQAEQAIAALSDGDN